MSSYMRTEFRERNFLSLRRGDKWKLLVIYLVTLCGVFASVVAKFLWRGSILQYDFDTYIKLLMDLALLLGAMFIYIINSRKKLVYSKKTLMAICSIVIMTFWFNIVAELYAITIMPIAACAFLLAPFVERRDSFVCNVICVLMITVTHMTEANALGDPIYDFLPIGLVGILCGSLVSYNISVNTKRLSYIFKGLIIGALCYCVLIAYLEISNPMNFVGILPHIAVAIFLQILLGLLLQPIIEAVFNLLTNSRLVELTDHNSPLIRRLIAEAPGTFNHCLAVANFAEICASAIGENPYLARACAYYHDIGKLVNPKYFKENQAEYNPHDEILPELSAEIIRNHTIEGLELCKQYRIPREIALVTVEHHGTLPIMVFYMKAKSLTDSNVDIADYSYQNPTPTSKIAAIIMLCDSGEAAIRAMDDPNGEKVDALMRSLISDRIKSGQFDNCDITLRDLDIIRSTVVNIYGGLFHSRIKYPDGK